MDLEPKVREAVLAELQRQAEINDQLRVTKTERGVRIEGEIDVDELVMAVVGSVAGGP